MQMKLLWTAASAVPLLLVSAGLSQMLAGVTSGVSAAPQAGESITLYEAIRRAQSSDPTFASAIADNAVARAERRIARSTLLPGLTYDNTYVYTQPQHVNGRPTVPGASAPIFIANNTVHEYISQGSLTENLSPAAFADLRRVSADAEAAKARLEIARRGLVSTVVGSYYGVLAADARVPVMQRALDEANHFATLTGQLEQGGEVAHADTIKAALQVQQRVRDLGDAQVNAERARLDLAVLLFANPLTPYTVAGALDQLPVLPTRDQIAAAAPGNPDVKAAIASLQAAAFEITAARFAYLPALSLNFNYGIDAPQFAIHARDGTRNLGYSAFATFNIPVWDWFATRARVQQSNARRDLAKVELTSTQRRLVASIAELYREAEVSRQQITTFNDSVRDATEALRLSNLRYASGDGSVLEVADAQNTLITIQNSQLDASVRYFTALADLQTLTGNMP